MRAQTSEEKHSYCIIQPILCLTEFSFVKDQGQFKEILRGYSCPKKKKKKHLNTNFTLHKTTLAFSTLEIKRKLTQSS